MIAVLDYILVAVTGVLTKVTDNIADEKIGIPELRFFTGIAYGALVGHLLSIGPEFSTVIAAIIIGNLAFGRIDDRAHQIALAVVFLMAVVFGISPVNFVFLVILAIAAWMDELLNEKADKNEGTGFWVIAKQRLVLEIAALGVSVYTGNINYIAVLFLFDLSYHLVDRIMKK